MRGFTHELAGVLAASLWIPHTTHPVLLLGAAAFGSLVPDVDHPRSTLGRWIPWPAVSHSRGPQAPPAVGRQGFPHPIWHRHQFHSVAAVVTLSGLIALAAHGLVGHRAWLDGPWPFATLFTGLLIGGGSHLVLDGFNQETQWWFWPVTRHGFRWPVHFREAAIDGAIRLALVAGMVWRGLAWWPVLSAWVLSRLPHLGA